MNNYDRMAAHYDLFMGDRTNAQKILRDLIKQHAPKSKTVLELGCGTGRMLEGFKKNYNLYGIDLAAEMLSIAKRRIPHASFSRQDISRFSLDKRFDLILCLFDTVNHLTTFTKWKALFRRVTEHLGPQGVFIFDINTPARLERYSQELAFAEIEDKYISLVDVHPVSNGMFELNLSMLIKNSKGLYKRYDSKVYELTVPKGLILKELRSLFKSVTVFDPDRKVPSIKSQELYFICKVN